AASLNKPLTMLLFGMMNWMFTWLQPEGKLSHSQMAPVVADLFLGGLGAVRLDPVVLPPTRRTRSAPKSFLTGEMQ
ncbi:MAG: hypothetical protein Q7T78_00915, partial [Rhodoferax sp.]|nr:hypothetical protein [Rhodoferax sp.]